jgi:hypothetical protein
VKELADILKACAAHGEMPMALATVVQTSAPLVRSAAVASSKTS